MLYVYKHSRNAYKRWFCVAGIGQVANSSLYRKIQSITKLPQTLTLTQSSALLKCFPEFSAGVPLVRGMTSVVSSRSFARVTFPFVLCVWFVQQFELCIKRYLLFTRQAIWQHHVGRQCERRVMSHPSSIQNLNRINPQATNVIYIYMEYPFLMFLDHTQRRSTVGRTPLDE